MTISPEQLQAWKRLADEATSGPWDSYFETGLNPMVVTYTENEKGLRSLKDAVVHGPSITNNNFIAAARTAVPALIAEVERLQHREFSLNLDLAVEGTSKIAHEMENIRLRKQLQLCREQRNVQLRGWNSGEQVNSESDYEISELDAEIEAIK